MPRIHRSPFPDVAVPSLSISAYVFADAERHGDRPALVDGVSGETLTYRDLVADVRAGAAGLATLGVAPGDVVGVVSPNQPAFAVAFHAITTAGAAVTPMNPISTVEEISRQLAASGARAVLAAPPVAEKVAAAAEVAGVEHVVVLPSAGEEVADRTRLSFRTVLARGREALAAGATLPEITDPATALAALPYSSGTSGAPKGVMLTHRNLVANLAQLEPVYRLTSDDVICAALPFFHIYGMTLLLNAGLRAGAKLVTLPRFDLETYLGTIERHRVTRGHFAPPLVLALANAPEVDKYDLSSLRLGVSGAAPLDVEVAARASARIGCPIGQGYGMTEASPGLLFVPDEEVGVVSAGSVGRLHPSTEARLVDPATGADAETEGELWARGPQVMAGYLGDPRSTAATLVEDGWLRTGDVLRVDEDGLWWVVDRVKELIKYKGYQVAPAELEALLLTHPAVLDAAVIGVPHAEGGEAPKAYVVLRAADDDTSADDGSADTAEVTGAPPTGDELMAWVAERVAPYKRIRAVELVEAIPKSPSGKILRRVLRSRQ